MPEPFTITELSGSERAVELRDRCLPYRPVAYPGEQRHEKTKYPGNPIATIQVLGADEMNQALEGRWKDRHLRKGNQVVLTGWSSIISPGETPTVEQLCQIFHTLRRSGNLVEVRWGPEIRRGIIRRFEPKYHRLDVAEWTINFEWTQYGTGSESPFSNVQTTATMSAELAATLAALNDLRSGMPPVMMPLIVSEVLELMGLIQAATIELTTSVAAVSGVPEVTQDEFQGIASKTTDVVFNSAQLRRILGDLPPPQLVPTDDVNDLLAGATFGRDMSSALVAMATAAVRAREETRDRVTAAYIADIRLREGQTLRDVAREYYGAPDDWTVIADANGLVGSVHPPGTRVLVPARSTGSGRAA